MNLFFKRYIGKPKLNPVKTYPDMKTEKPVKIIDLRHLPDQITAKKMKTSKKMALILIMLDVLVLIRRREIELISDGNKSIEVKVM